MERPRGAIRSFEGLKLGDVIFGVRINKPEILKTKVHSVNKDEIFHGMDGSRTAWIEECSFGMYRWVFKNYWDAYAYWLKLKAGKCSSAP